MTSPSADAASVPVGSARVSLAGRSAQLESLRQQNYSVIMRTVMQSGPIARTDLADAIGMSTGTVTRLTGSLTRNGLMTETIQPVTGAKGRPKVPVQIDESRFGVIGVYFGYRRIIVCLLSLTGRLIDEVQEPQASTGFAPLVTRAVGLIQELSAKTDLTILGIGASTGGWVDAPSGVVHEHPVLGWKAAPLADSLSAASGLPTIVDSHFRALAMAEHWFGSATGVENLIHLFIGNVVGAGFVFDGRPYRGARSAAGGLDHLSISGAAGPECVCGRTDCLRVVASDLEVTRRARDIGLIGIDDQIQAVVALADAGSRPASELLVERAEWVGAATATLIEILDPEFVVVGGGVSSPPEYLDIVRAAAADRLDQSRSGDIGQMIRASAFGPHAAGVAAGAVFLDEFYRAPEHYVPELATRVTSG